MDRRKTIYLLLFSLFVSVKAQSNTIAALFPAEDSGKLCTALKEYGNKYLPQNTTLAIKCYNDTNRPDLIMNIMRDIFTRPNNFTAILGPADESAIHTVYQFMNTLPGNVLQLVNNPLIESKKYRHNMAPPTSRIVHVLFELLSKMKWNYVAVLTDSSEFSKFSGKMFEKKAGSKRICIGMIDMINSNVREILNDIESAQIKGVIVFGTKYTVRMISEILKIDDKDLRFIFVSNENLHSIIKKLPYRSLLVTWNGAYKESPYENKLKYVDASVQMAIKWFKICQTHLKCRDLKSEEIILEIYQQINNGNQIRVGTFTENLTLNSKLEKSEKSESCCVSECKKCHILDRTPNFYNLINAEYNILLLLPLHKQESGNHFKCSRSINILNSVDLVEAAKYAIEHSSNKSLGLIIIDSCIEPIITIEQLIAVNYTNILGVIGGFYSLTTIPATEILTHLKIPSISFGAESHVLSDHASFPYFQRIVPSARTKAKAIIQLCKRMGWKAINIIYNKEPFGISGRSLFVEYARMYGICIVNDIAVKLGEVKFPIHLNKLRKTRGVKVIITMLLNESQKEWLTVLNEELEENEFLIIEAYGVREKEIVAMQKKIFKSTVVIEVKKTPSDDFQKSYKKLTQEKREENPWAKKFIEEKDNCYFHCSFSITENKKGKCGSHANLNDVSTYSGFLIMAIHALINGTNNSTTDPSKRNVTDIVMKIRQTRFHILGDAKERIFDDDGESQIKQYKLMQIKTTDPLKYETIATYKNETWDLWNDWRGIFQTTSTCNPDDSCHVCPEEKSDHRFLAFVILDSILAFVIAVLIGLFVWKNKGNILTYFHGVSLRRN